MIAGFKENSPLHATGVHINGVKYFTLRANDNEVLAKKGPTGIACYKTTQGEFITVEFCHVQWMKKSLSLTPISGCLHVKKAFDVLLTYSVCTSSTNFVVDIY